MGGPSDLSEDVALGHTPDVIRAVAAYGLSASRLRLPSAPLADLEWPLLQRCVTAERLSGLLGAAIGSGAFPVTESQRSEALADRLGVAARCLQLEGSLIRVQQVLARLGVHCRVLKGPAVANLNYADPSLRPFVDVDLLVSPDNFEVAVRGLLDENYVRNSPEPRPGFDRRFGKGATFRAPDGTAIDLHRTFVMGPFGISMVVDDLWVPPEAFVVAGRKFEALPSELRLLHACYHAVLGDWPRRILPHRDIAEILLSGRCDEAAVRRISSRWRGDAIVALGVREAWSRLGIETDHPLVLWARGYVVNDEDRRLISLYAREQASYAALSVAALGRIQQIPDKVSYLRALLLPDRAYVHDHHASSVGRLLNAVRSVRPRRENR